MMPPANGGIMSNRFASRNGIFSMRNAELVLRLTGLRKSYEAVRALRGVSFDLRAGEVHALVGENGAGKSTLIKAITGAVAPDDGRIEVAGQAVPWMSPHEAAAAGIAAIYQQPALFPDLSVAENIALRVEQGGAWRFLHWNARRARARALLERIGARIDPDRVVDSLSMPEQQVVEIASAVGVEARIVIMDEPTASLGEREVASLFQAIAAMKEHGAGIIYISHRLEEIFALADRVTVLRDGESVGTYDASAVSRAELVRLMAGRALAAEYAADSGDAEAMTSAKRTEHRARTEKLLLDRIGHAPSGVHDVTLSVRAGEVLGLAGLVGSGRTELAEILFGLRPADAGTIRVDGEAVRLASPSDAIARGIAYVPEDRRRHGVVLDMSIAANTTLANLRSVSTLGLIDRGAERSLATSFVERLQIKASSVDAEVATLSGGNQQKVALARWLATRPAVLVLDEPTQGVDVGAKAEIHRLIGDLAADGLAVLVISSELPELLAISDRIAVMHAGTIAGVVDRAQATQDGILNLAFGHGAPEGHA
jgi:rhamnose transport system ATP-binding protein